MLIALIVVVANVLTAARLICYQRHGARYRPVMSILAYALIVCSGGQVIDVLINGSPVTIWQAGFSSVVALLVLRARGNVASVVRTVA
ncbi:phage holin family protein [Pararhodobacter sp.]|uniref:phage holin family protein n=1 Tax=Pararhodobacter sp. TaxID=2127056 RepID=UPI002AFE2409|nr:phage holin family protein [Pararhodobacter sp.]